MAKKSRTLTIDVAFGIGDKVESVLTEKQYMVVGYEYLEGRGVQYTVTDGSERKYAVAIELKLCKKSTLDNIGFKVN